MQTSDARTENDAVTHSTSDSPLVDLFFKIGGLRAADDARILSNFWRAFNINPLFAMRILFYSRDIRGGQGERRIFRTILKDLANSPIGSEWLSRNISSIPYYGRWDDLFELIGTPLQSEALQLYGTALSAGDALAAKWAPREKSSKSKIAYLLRKQMGLKPKQYRKMLVEATTVVENQMCSQKWDNIKFSSVPSCAMKQYRKAFERNCTTYAQYIKDLTEGKEKVNASVLYPHDLVYSVGKHGATVQERTLLNEMWNSLPDFFDGNQRNILPVVDTSGSMLSKISSKSSVTCLDVSVGLGMYLAERNQGMFKNSFITFSSKPTIQNIQGYDLYSKSMALKQAAWRMTTDLQTTFDLILRTGKNHQIPQSEMPEMILIISDMEFDQAITDDWYNSSTSFNRTNMDEIRRKYAESGYDIPQLVFWNVQSRSDDNIPVKQNDAGVALISGFSPSIMKQLLSNKSFTPEAIMLSIVNSKRYGRVS
jgi:hypothetical protein